MSERSKQGTQVEQETALPQDGTQSTSKLKEIAKIGAVPLAVAGFAGGLVGLERAIPMPPTPKSLQEVQQEYPSVKDEAGVANPDLIQIAGEWNRLHPEARIVVIKEVNSQASESRDGYMADAEVAVGLKSGKTIEADGSGNTQWDGRLSVPGLGKYSGPSEEMKIALQEGSEKQALTDALNSADKSISTPAEK